MSRQSNFSLLYARNAITRGRSHTIGRGKRSLAIFARVDLVLAQVTLYVWEGPIQAQCVSPV